MVIEVVKLDMSLLLNFIYIYIYKMEGTVDLSPYAIFEMMDKLNYEDLTRLCGSYTGIQNLCKDPIAIEILERKKREMLERLDFDDLKRICGSYSGMRDLCKDPIAIEILERKKREMLETVGRIKLNYLARKLSLTGYSRFNKSDLINFLDEIDVEKYLYL